MVLTLRVAPTSLTSHAPGGWKCRTNRFWLCCFQGHQCFTNTSCYMYLKKLGHGLHNHNFIILGIMFSNILQNCEGCDCTHYLTNRGYFMNETFTTDPPTTTVGPATTQSTGYNVVDNQGSNVVDSGTFIMYQSCGVQVYSGMLTSLVILTVVKSYIHVSWRNQITLLFFLTNKWNDMYM